MKLFAYLCNVHGKNNIFECKSMGYFYALTQPY